MMKEITSFPDLTSAGCIWLLVLVVVVVVAAAVAAAVVADAHHDQSLSV